MNLYRSVLRVADPLIAVIAGLVAYFMRFGDFALPPTYRTAIAIAFAMTIIVFNANGVYRWRSDEGLRVALGRLVSGWGWITLALITLLYATRTGAIYSRLWFAGWAALSLACLIAGRVAWLYALRTLYARGKMIERVAIVGTVKTAAGLIRRFRRNPESGLRVVAVFVDANQPASERDIESVPICGAIAELRPWLAHNRVEQVWIALPLRTEAGVGSMLDSLADVDVRVRLVPDLVGFRVRNQGMTEVVGIPVLNVTEPPLTGAKRILKWIEDKAIALAVVAVIWPLLVALAIAVKLSSPGPVLFKQRRGGLDNVPIVVWKFRSMHVHDELAVSSMPQATRNDPRITRIGAWMRRTSLDELPQFINVLMGRMSVVGPRPHAAWMDDFYRDKIPRYALRSWIKPGITGWAQVCGWRGETDELWKMETRIQYDLYYMENWSLTFDLYIILMTVFRLRSPQAF